MNCVGEIASHTLAYDMFSSPASYVREEQLRESHSVDDLHDETGSSENIQFEEKQRSEI